jgi:hypothetical protein
MNHLQRQKEDRKIAHLPGLRYGAGRARLRLAPPRSCAQAGQAKTTKPTPPKHT